MLQIFLAASPFYQRTWFWLLIFFATLVLSFYALRWFARKRYQEIMETRKKANARIRELLKDMKERR